ncbi:MAG: DUF2812 domain-containing protein [Anaerolineae bacterium]
MTPGTQRALMEDDMTAETMTKFKVFWAWQDEQEEVWLREMANQGWHLSSVRLPGIYRFRRGEPRDVAYRLDFTTERKEKYQEYLQLFRDAGWEHVGKMGSWQYFRKAAAAGEEPQIYTDPESKIQKYRRLLGALIAIMPVYIVLLIAPPFDEFSAVAAVFMLFFAVAILKLTQRINELKRTRDL